MSKVTAIKNQTKDTLNVSLSGSIEENVNLDELFGPVTGSLKINCHEVRRINSVGVKEWVRFFSKLSDEGIKYSFTECSPAIIEQTNIIINFIPINAIESLLVPYACRSCKTESVVLYTPDELSKLDFNLKDLKCQKCDGISTFDDIADEYFAFLKQE